MHSRIFAALQLTRPFTHAQRPPRQRLRSDAVVFTGGIGEHSPDIRSRICAGLDWAGLTLDASRNQAIVGREGCISTAESTLHAWVIPTNEELLIARDTVRCVLGEPHS